MNGPGDQLLAGSGLALDQDRRIRGRYPSKLRHHFAQGLGGTNNFLEHRRAHDLLAQRDVFVSRPVFGPLTIIDISSRRIPANDLSGLVQQWVVLDQEPPILTIFSQSPLLIFEWSRVGEGLVPFFAKSLNVVGMENARP